MKKLLGILIILGAIFLPNTASASSYKVNYYCDAKQPLDDGTFYMSCHLLLNSDMDINHVKGSLILKNVKLQSIKTSGDWTSNNGLSSNVDFTSKTTHKGSFSVADFVFTGNLSDTECEASYVADIAENKKEEPTVCKIVDDIFYGKNGDKVTEEKYYEECFNYSCTVVDNKYYFNKSGKSVTHDEMLKDCSETTAVVTPVPESPQTGIDYGYIFLPLGIISTIAIIKFVKKNQKVYKI